MGRKTKGINAERDLIKKLWDVGFSACRVAGSGSSHFPSPDIIAGNKLRKLAIECKTTKDDSKYIAKEDIEQLKIFSTIFGAEPWVAIKFKSEDWLFLSLDDLEETKKNFLISKEIAKKRGLLLEELIR